MRSLLLLKPARVLQISLIPFSLMLSMAASSAFAEDVLEILGAKNSQTAQAVQNLDSSLVRELRNQIGSTTAEQNIFFEFLKANQLEKALYQWGPAFRGHRFAASDTGRALYGYLLFRAGLQVSGAETLFQAKNPTAITKAVQGLWREVATPTHPVWSQANLVWAPDWTKVFDLATEVKVRGRHYSDVKNSAALVELLKKTSVDSEERAWLQWQVALGMALNGDVGQAAKVLKNLMEAKNSKVGLDHLNITAARLLYQNGYLDAAIEYYQKVPKSSDFWLEAQEELGWAYIRKGEPQNALAKTLTLMAPVFTNQLGPEAVFLHSLGQLKICDYPGVAQSLKAFRERFRPKAQLLVELAKTGVTDDSEKLVERLKQGPARTEELGPIAARVPRLAARDELLGDFVRTQRQMEEETKVAADLYARSLTGGTDQVGFQASIAELRKSVEARAQSARAASFGRLKALAEAELKEFENILQKLHIVEAELIQQISQAERVIAATKNAGDEKVGTTGSKAKDKMVFPFTGEIWFDELANYNVTVKKGCAAGSKGKKL